MNKKRFITLLSLFSVALMVLAQGRDKLVSNQILMQKVIDEGGNGMFKAEKAKNFKQRPGKIMSQTMPCQMLKGISERDYSIYLPGSYDTDTLRRYPVLYLMHGGGGAHTDFERHNRISHMTDSLIDCGAIDDMIIVMPEGNKLRKEGKT